MALVLLVVLAGCFLIYRANSEWKKVNVAPMGSFSGPATLMADPSPFGQGAGVRAVFQIDGWRYEALLYGVAGRRVAKHLSGESVWLSAQRERIAESQQRRRAVQHIVGKLNDVRLSSDWRDGSAGTRATNRLRRLLAHGASQLPRNEAALLLGLIIGDDRAQPREMVQAFRDSGLSHLTAVSGQNIAFVLAAAAPILTRMRPRARLALTLGLVGWFTVLTRGEPSVLRAAAMAAIAAVCFTAGWKAKSLIVLVVSAYGLSVVDPMLLWSVGFWLSVGATAGLVLGVPPLLSLFERCRVPQLLRLPLATTLAAQLGTALPMFLVFGRISPIGLVTNLFAVPVAGVVMLVGLPICVVTALVPQLGGVLQIPLLFGVRWVWWVAELGQRVTGA